MDQRVSQVIRRLPATLLKPYDLRPKTKALYEPKTKVQINNKEHKFKVHLDTTNYQPDEINVKVFNDRLAIYAKHKAKSDSVYEYHERIRSFDLPEGMDPKSVTYRVPMVNSPSKPL
ncbi:hypothetical protein CDAR_555801 [Caerostris darwini]|uniref:SHSP domain-containing protein n=1 Tax=Caerostris darwini TaxID=1538125 RepID=A0AAV4X0K9_9ARAC|nr:hypothetical protein CDAR_555801 [Caerostris darwini]